ncbi:MAG: PDZ domain-containing protein, partial [Nitrospira sp.]|nr:PDZ domain-containing protein [Nitrospira sp.]
VVRGWLGVSVQPITHELAQQFHLDKDYGTLVADVVEGSPAAKAGIMRGDVIIAFDGQDVGEPYTLRNMSAGTVPGTEAELKLIRNRETLVLSVTIEEIPSDTQVKASTVTNALSAVSVQDLTPDIFRQLGLPDKIRGVVVTGIKPGSPAERALMPGDILLEVNRRAISGISDYEATIAKLAPETDILLLVFRRGSTIFVTISPD